MSQQLLVYTMIPCIASTFFNFFDIFFMKHEKRVLSYIIRMIFYSYRTKGCSACINHILTECFVYQKNGADCTAFLTNKKKCRGQLSFAFLLCIVHKCFIKFYVLLFFNIFLFASDDIRVIKQCYLCNRVSYDVRSISGFSCLICKL